MAFSGCPRGPSVLCETECPRHATPILATETRSRTRVSREPDGHRQKKSPEMERTRSETLKLFVVSDVGRRSTLLSSTPSTRWWQSSWPRSDAPSSACAKLNEVAKLVRREEDDESPTETKSMQVKSDLDLLPHRPRLTIRALGRLKLPLLDCFDSLLG
jgi:hypothetical protein